MDKRIKTGMPDGSVPGVGSGGLPSVKNMTLRQWYAGLAMQGFLAGPRHESSSWQEDCELLGGCDDAWSPLARDAFDIADAMLAHEKKEQE